MDFLKILAENSKDEEQLIKGSVKLFYLFFIILYIGKKPCPIIKSRYKKNRKRS